VQRELDESLRKCLALEGQQQHEGEVLQLLRAQLVEKEEEIRARDRAVADSSVELDMCKREMAKVLYSSGSSNDSGDAHPASPRVLHAPEYECAAARRGADAAQQSPADASSAATLLQQALDEARALAAAAQQEAEDARTLAAAARLEAEDERGKALAAGEALHVAESTARGAQEEIARLEFAHTRVHELEEALAAANLAGEVAREEVRGRLQNELAGRLVELEAARREAEDERAKMLAMQEEIEGAERLRAEAEEEVLGLREQLATVQQQREEVACRLAAVEAGERSAVENAVQRLREKETGMAELEARFADLQKNLAAAEEAVVAQQAREEQHKEEIGKLQATAEAQGEESARACSRAKELEGALNSVQGQLVASQQCVEVLQADLAAAVDAVAELREREEERCAEVRELQASVRELQASLESASQEREREAAESASQRMEVSALEKAREEAERAIGERERGLEERESVLEERSSHVAAREREVAQKEAEVEGREMAAESRELEARRWREGLERREEVVAEQEAVVGEETRAVVQRRQGLEEREARASAQEADLAGRLERVLVREEEAREREERLRLDYEALEARCVAVEEREEAAKAKARKLAEKEQVLATREHVLLQASPGATVALTVGAGNGSVGEIASGDAGRRKGLEEVKR